jgi:gamma-glutamylcysteine synthetase
VRTQERCGPDEGRFLDPLREIVAQGQTPAEEALLRLDGQMKGDVRGLLGHWSVA